MKTHARAVVIGGGVIGTSVLYHLAKLGWTDTVLLEKAEIASGTTWHAAGNLPQLTGNFHLARMLVDGIRIYRELEAATGQPTGIKQVGSLRLATTQDRLDELKVFAGRAASLDIPFEIVSAARALELAPIISTEDVLAAGWVPTDGYCDPSSLTAAFAAGARSAGAQIERRTLVTGTQRTPSGEWLVETSRGAITCEVVVNAAGQWARDLGRMVDIDLPILPYEHQYLVFGAIPAIERLAVELPTLRDPDGSWYARQEGSGLLVGGYESDARAWSPERVPIEFEGALLPADLERIRPITDSAARRFPGLADAAIRKVYNGPDGYTPDHRFLMGEVPGRRGYFVLAGFNSLGIAASGGSGRQLAEWIAQGEPGADMSQFDVRRFGGYASETGYLIARIDESYAQHYEGAFPGHETHAGRPLKTDSLYDCLHGRGAVMGERFGWERPLWYAPVGVEPVDRPTFRRPNWFEQVGAECRAVRERVGILDQSSFAKYEVTGPNSGPFLEGLVSSRLPHEDGRLVYTMMLTPSGGVETDLTITRLAPDRWYVVTAAAAEFRDRAWLDRWLPVDGSVRIETTTGAWGVLTVAGPRSRELLSRVSPADFSPEAFPFRSAREVPVGNAPVRALRVSYSGELGWELHLPIEYLRHLYAALLDAGSDLGIADYGYRALESLRLEKGYPLWGEELSPKRSPDESGVGRFVAIDKGDFVGRDALLAQRAAGLSKRLACLVIEDVPDDGGDAVPFGYEPVLDGGRCIGILDSAGYGHTLGKSLGYAVLPLDRAMPGTELEVTILERRRPAVVRHYPIYDPKGLRLRA